jgi:hypothetical protein
MSQDQSDILWDVFLDLQGENNVPYGIFGFTLNDVNNSDGGPLYGVLDTSNAPKGGSSGAYCRFAETQGQTPSGC